MTLSLRARRFLLFDTWKIIFIDIIAMIFSSKSHFIFLYIHYMSRVENSMLEHVQPYIDFGITGVMAYVPKIFGALVVLWIGFKIANGLGKLLTKALDAKKIDPTIEAFLVSLIKNILKAWVFIAAIGILWVQTTAFVAAFAAVGLAIGMALSGTLGHFASGIMILLFKPYKVGDLIETSGHFWVVKEVQIFNTILTTIDAKTIIIPNSDAIGGSIVNYSIEAKKRIDLDVGISYSDNIDTARKVLQEVAKKDARVLHDDEVSVFVKSLGDSAVIMCLRVWVKSEDYWPALADLTEETKKAFDATKGELNFPFPQRDVHIHNA